MKNLKEVIYNGVCKMLEENNYRFFLGGSRRFGYHSEDSDYDIFVFYDRYDVIQQDLLVFGFEEIGGGYDGFKSIVFIISDEEKNIIIHLNALPELKKFEDLLIQHQVLSNSLKPSEHCQMVTRIKSDFPKFKGAELYKLLLAIFNIE